MRRQSPLYQIFVKGWSRRYAYICHRRYWLYWYGHCFHNSSTAGHQVLGHTRSDAGASSLNRLGADVHRGSLEDLASLRSGAASVDGVIHTAFIHDFLNYAAAAEADRRAIETLGNALAGSGRPLVITSGTLLLRRQGPFATENDQSDPNFPRKSEAAGLAMVSQGVRVSVLRLPPSVHGDGDHGFVPRLIGIAREKGALRYMSVSDSIVGSRCIGSTPPRFTGWR